MKYMNKHKQRLVSTLVTSAVLALLILAACGDGKAYNKALEKPLEAVVTPADTPVTLRVVTEETFRHCGMDDQIEHLANAYMDEHSNVMIEIEYLPQESENRDVALTRLRTEITAGDGPDIFLLPTTFNGSLMPLFSDPELGMFNGHFHEISAYYNADTELHPEDLNTAVMNVGTIGQARYILPLAYDIPVLLVQEEVLAKYGLTPTDITGNIEQLLDQALVSTEPLMQCGFELASGMGVYYLDALGKPVDYRSGKAAYTLEQVTNFLTKYQQYQIQMQSALAAIGANEDLEEYATLYPIHSQIRRIIQGGKSWTEYEIPYNLENLTTAYQSKIIEKYTGTHSQAYPLPGMDGKLTARVTYWGAVGSSCDYADVAYDFLRLFLLEDTQWERNRTEELAGQAMKFYGEGFPVRIQGAAVNLVPAVARLNSNDASGDKKVLLQKIANVKIVDADFPLLDAKIDKVRFGSTFDREFALLAHDIVLHAGDQIVINPELTPRDGAKKFIRDLEFFLAES